MLEFLRHIKNEDLDLIGIPSKTSRPDWMICTVFPVPPPHVRPSVRQDNNQKSEDDLTHKLAEIITRNQTLREEIEKSVDASESRTAIIEDWTQVLQYHVSTFIDNEIPGIPKAIQRSGRPIKSIKQRLMAKEGRMRLNLMGKRGDQTGRTVITAEPNIALDEIGVPLKIAVNLTFPENVNKYNIERLRQYVRNGVKDYPGAKSVQKKIRTDNGNVVYRMYSLSINKTIEIEIGDIVHRNLIDGDIIFFNRQPSLHKMSMMGHRVRVLKVGNTFRMNVSATTPYNADFDGDEMNVFMTQCMEGAAELKYLTLVPHQIVSPQRNQCVIGLVQDTLFACPQLTHPSVRISPREWMNMEMLIGRDVQRVETDPSQMTGRRIFEALIPRLNMKRATNLTNFRFVPVEAGGPSDDVAGELVIADGRIVQGVVDKNVVGTKAGGFIHVLWKDHGPNVSANFIYNCQKVCAQWLMTQGHSMGVSDCVFLEKDGVTMAEGVYKDIHNVIYNAMCEVRYLLELGKRGLYNTRSDRSIEEDMEKEIMHILNKARDDAGRRGIQHVMESNTDGVFENRLLRMVLAGSKGDFNNVSQIMCTMGQSEVAGARTPKKFCRRTLPHYTKDDNSPEARGFAQHSFKEGLEPNEMYFLGISTRVGLIDKTVKTADTGYTQRRLIKSMEDLTVGHDGTVRTASNAIVQFAYGDDFFDATYLETVSFAYHADPRATFIRHFYAKEAVDEFEALWRLRQRLRGELGIGRTTYTPANVRRLFDQVIHESHGQSTWEVATPNYVDAARRRLLCDIARAFDASVQDQDFLEGDLVDAVARVPRPMSLFAAYVVFETAWAVLHGAAQRKGRALTRDLIDALFRKITQMFVRAICSAGEMVGILCGQSIGEPTTQMTLNTFHHIGVASKSPTTTGVPRMKELLSASKNMKTPSMCVFLKDGSVSRYTYEQIRDFSMQIEYTSLRHIVSRLDVFWDGPYVNTCVVEDREWLQEFLNESDANIEGWVVRFTLDYDKYLSANIAFTDIVEAIESTRRGSDVRWNPSESVVRMHVSVKDDDTQNVWHNIQRLEKQILDARVKGVPGVNSVYVDKQKTRVVGADSGHTDTAMEALSEPNVDDGITMQEEWVIYTNGSNVEGTLTTPLAAVHGIELDGTRLRTNDIQEAMNVFGIEMARQALIDEFTDVLSSTGGVNMRHVTILVDTMTSRGVLIPIDRHGVKKNDIGPLSRATFEETVDQLLKAATFGEVDTMQGVSANIMMGQVAPCGTGCVQILIDERKILSAPREAVVAADMISAQTVARVIHRNEFAAPVRKTVFRGIVPPIPWFGVVRHKIVVQ